VKKKIVFLGLSVLFVASMIITSCATKTSTTTSTTNPPTSTTKTTVATTTTATTVKTTTTSATTSNEPQYGGSLAVATDWMNADPGGWDGNLTPTPWSTAVYDSPYMPWLLLGNIEKFGPRGTNQYSFNTTEFFPEQYGLGGDGILDSWEITSDPTTFTFHLRHGIMYAGNSLLGMAPRELTADDVLYSMTRSQIGTMAAGVYVFIDKRVELDKYTVQLQCNRFDANWCYYLCYGYYPGMIVPPESGNATIGGGSEDWKNQVSAGPFIISDYVPGAGITYKPNPGYTWEKTTINGKQYQMPFIDTLTFPLIADQATVLSALRTGKLDWWGAVPIQYAATLKQSSPQLVQFNYPSNRPYLIRMNRIDNQYIKILDVRRALQIGTDFGQIRDLVNPGGDLLSWPMAKGDPAYTPLDQLPDNIKVLFSNDPTTAKKMIADAGFPNGFTLTMTIQANDPDQESYANLLAAQWAKIGVTLKIQVLDATAFDTAGNNRTFDMLVLIMSTSNANVPLNWANVAAVPANNGWLYYRSEPFTPMYEKMNGETDVTKRIQDEKDLAFAMLADAGFMQMPNPLDLNCWWPWMKNYYNETDCGYHNDMAMIQRIWIDQKLKASLGH
jgi:peptide/nickel transport system substrate-binding protein